jgi:hypothetical protein
VNLLLQTPPGVTVSFAALSIIVSAVGLIIGAATVYLRLFLGSELAKTRQDIIHGIKLDFVTKEVAQLQFGEVHRRLDRVEGSGSRRGVNDE